MEEPRVVRYVHEISGTIRLDMCDIMDAGPQVWRKIAAKVGYSPDRIDVMGLQALGRGLSPSNYFLMEWSSLNPTLHTLFQVLYVCQQRRLMDLLRTIAPKDVVHMYYQDDGNESLCSARVWATAPPLTPAPSLTPVSPQRQMDLRLQSPVYPNGGLSNQQMSVNERPSENDHRLPLAVACGNHNQRSVCGHSDRLSANVPPHQRSAVAQQSANGGSRQQSVSETSHRPSYNGPQQPRSPNGAPNQVSYTGPQQQRSSNGAPNQLSTNGCQRLPAAMARNQERYATDSTSLNQQDTGTDSGPGSSDESLVKYSYKEIVQGTGNWSQCCGVGSFGEVYRAYLNGTDFAVKRFQQLMPGEDPEMRITPTHAKELFALSKFRHPQIISLFGYCVDEDICLVYEFMDNGSLYKSLHEQVTTNSLSVTDLGWRSRLNILTDAACGLQYLHSVGKQPMVHSAIKSSNILLDVNHRAKLADFGLADVANKSSSLDTRYTHVSRQTRYKTLNAAYAAPEVAQTGQFGVKSDTFAFGVVVLETCTGQKAEDPERRPEHRLLYLLVRYFQRSNRELALIDTKRRSDAPDGLVQELMELGLRCSSDSKARRPSMVDVLSRLNLLKQTYENELMVRGRDLPVPMVSTDGRLLMTSPVFSDPVSVDRCLSGSSYGSFRQQEEDDEHYYRQLPLRSQSYDAPASTRTEEATLLVRDQPNSYAGVRYEHDGKVYRFLSAEYPMSHVPPSFQNGTFPSHSTDYHDPVLSPDSARLSNHPGTKATRGYSTHEYSSSTSDSNVTYGDECCQHPYAVRYVSIPPDSKSGYESLPIAVKRLDTDEYFVDELARADRADTGEASGDHVTSGEYSTTPASILPVDGDSRSVAEPDRRTVIDRCPSMSSSAASDVPTSTVPDVSDVTSSTSSVSDVTTPTDQNDLPSLTTDPQLRSQDGSLYSTNDSDSESPDGYPVTPVTPVINMTSPLGAPEGGDFTYESLDITHRSPDEMPESVMALLKL